MKKSSKSMSMSAKMVNFFIQSMLDFVVINEKERNFTKEITRFEVKKAFEQVVEIM